MLNVLIGGFLSKSSGEFAPGIPSRDIKKIPEINKPVTWRLVVQKHPAERSGDHYDIRLVDESSGRAHSWATKKELPMAGKTIKTFQQFTHKADYADYEGPLPKGYGKTRAGEMVKKVIDTSAEIVQSDNDLVRFNLYEGGAPREMLLVRDKKSPKSWYMMNVTKTTK